MKCFAKCKWNEGFSFMLLFFHALIFHLQQKTHRVDSVGVFLWDL